MDEPTGEPCRARPAWIRPVLLAAAGTAVVVALLATVGALRGDGRRVRPAVRFELHAWAPYWALSASTADLATPDGPGSLLGEVSPFWFTATGVTTIAPDPNAPPAATAAFYDAARRSGARLVPSVADGMPAGAMAAVLADPSQRAAHVAALLGLAADLGADGLDLDYEQFAFADARSTWSATRPNWVAFLEELAAGLHGAGRTLTVSVPPVYDAGQSDSSGYWVYDYAAMARIVDRIRVMAYDYSTAAAGPIAPLEWVHQAVKGTSEAAGDPAKLVLGIPQYGYNWPAGASAGCAGEHLQGRTSVTMRTLPGLLALRGATPVHDPVADEWSFTYQLSPEPATPPSSGPATVPAFGAAPGEPPPGCSQQREVHYVDLAGALERARIARRAGFGGVSLWALGYEDPALWPALGTLAEGPSSAG